MDLKNTNNYLDCEYAPKHKLLLWSFQSIMHVFINQRVFEKKKTKKKMNQTDASIGNSHIFSFYIPAAATNVSLIINRT